jgi:hypothetical protein
LHRSDVTEWAIWVKDIPAFGYKKYIIKAIDDIRTTEENSNSKTLENQWYQIETDL